MIIAVMRKGKKMDDLISRQALYERATTLESQALDYVGKLIERDGEEYSTEWKIWSAILTERTAFKHDVYDAPSAEKHGRWVLGDDGAFHCSCCEKIPVNKVFFYGMLFYDAKVAMVSLLKFCPYCGAKMEASDG